MTTAHRPTWRPAYGGPDQGGLKQFVATKQYSVRDLPAQMALKERKDPLQKGDDTTKLEEQLKQEELQFKQQGSLEPSLAKKIKGNDDIQKINILDISDSDSDEEEKEQSSDEELLKAAAKGYQNPFPQDQDDDNLLKESLSSDSDSDEFIFS